jgi:hypothetical protein
MTTTQTVLVYVAIPAAVAGVLALFVFGAGARRGPRYRPGRPFAFAPVWFVSARAQHDPASEHAALPAGADRPALPAGASAEPAERPVTKKGGARGTW